MIPLLLMLMPLMLQTLLMLLMPFLFLMVLVEEMLLMLLVLLPMMLLPLMISDARHHRRIDDAGVRVFLGVITRFVQKKKQKSCCEPEST